MNRTRRIVAAGAALILLANCDAIPQAKSLASIRPAAEASQGPAPAPTNPESFAYSGALTQGGWIRGQAPAAAISVTLGDQPLELDGGGRFFAAFDRDAPEFARLAARLPKGVTVEATLTIAPRAWDIEHVNLARPTGAASEAFMIRRRPELAQINAARELRSESRGWTQKFIWPVKGRISGRFGSQRIYAGVPGSYHSGIDITTGQSGTPFVAPADGVVVLAAQQPFSLEGYLLIIDHGMGLNSAFLHSSKLAVAVGDVVKQGQHLGNIGSTGSATGPHLHWSMKWRDTRLDPLLFAGPM